MTLILIAAALALAATAFVCGRVIAVGRAHEADMPVFVARLRDATMAPSFAVTGGERG
jgi:hypothetical protein